MRLRRHECVRDCIPYSFQVGRTASAPAGGRAMQELVQRRAHHRRGCTAQPLATGLHAPRSGVQPWFLKGLLMLLLLLLLLQLLLHRRLLQRAAQIGAELFLMLAQVHRLCNAVLINAQLGSIGRICD